ncbi:MAG: 30S ribosomal protein S16 [Candidatus Omnitrophica bacterium]|nr:30S ribosomal protein S16 [Candidatus Omnitrophota bacterium]
MAVHVRLRRIGKNPKKNPHFRVSVYEETRGRDGRFIEELGFYNPIKGVTKIKRERLEYWVKHGAQLSNTVKSIMKKTKES